jgi:hypothetical protein
LRALVFVTVVLVIAAVAFVLGTWVRSPDAVVLDARDQTVVVFASVESRSVSSDIRIQGEVAGAQQEPVYVVKPPGAQRSIVSEVAAHEGPFSNGAWLGKVSDRPIFVFSVEIPLFRDLAYGDNGPDVSSLQKALGVELSGTLDRSTLAAVRAVYAATKTDPPGGRFSGTYVSTDEFYTFPKGLGDVSLVSIAPLGSQLGESHPFAVLGFGTPYVTVRASVGEALQITPKERVTIDGVGGKSATGVVTEVGSFQQSSTNAGRPPGRDIRITLDAGSDLSIGESVSVLFGTKAMPDTAVPTLAIRSDASGDFVMKRAGAGPTMRVGVTVIRNADGWSAIRSEELKPGDEVLVSE